MINIIVDYTKNVGRDVNNYAGNDAENDSRDNVVMMITVTVAHIMKWQ